MGMLHKAQDGRAHTRREISLDILVAVPNEPLMTLRTGDMTKSGVYLLAGNRNLPEVGSEIVLTMEEYLQNADPTAMRGRVIHKNSNGMGVEMLGRVS